MANASARSGCDRVRSAVLANASVRWGCDRPSWPMRLCDRGLRLCAVGLLSAYYHTHGQVVDRNQCAAKFVCWAKLNHAVCECQALRLALCANVGIPSSLRWAGSDRCDRVRSAVLANASVRSGFAIVIALIVASGVLRSADRGGPTKVDAGSWKEVNELVYALQTRGLTDPDLTSAIAMLTGNATRSTSNWPRPRVRATTSVWVRSWKATRGS